MTSTILALAIATILTASVLVITLSSQAFAQPGRWIVDTGVLGHKHQTQFGKELGAQTTKSILGDVCLSCWNGFAAHETQQANEQATGLLGGINSHAEGTNTIAGVLAGGQEGGQTTTGTGNLGSTAPSGDTVTGSTLGSTNQPCSSSYINSITVRNQDSGFDLIPCIVH